MIAFVNPLVRGPTLAGMGRTLPAAGDPDITAVVPAVIAVDPHESSLRRPTAFFDDGSRRANADHNLRERSRREQCECKQ
jgi:hypothetical protein